MASYLNPSSTASAGTAIGKDPDARGGLRERARIVGGVHRLLSGGVAQDYTGTLRRWQLRWTGLTNAQWAVIKGYIQGGYQLYWQGPEMSAKVAVILEDAEQDQVHLNGDSAAAPHWNVSLTLREGTLANAVQYVYGDASITLGAVTLSSAGTFAAAALVFDQFTDTNGTNLTAHTIAPTNTLGGNWAVSASSGTGAFDIQSNQANISTSNPRVLAWMDSLVANATMTVKITIPTAFYGAGPSLRSTSNSNVWNARAYATSNVFQIEEITGGTTTSRASTSVTVNTATQYTIAFSVSGNNFTATLNGGSSLNYTSSVRNTATKHGFFGEALNTKFDDANMTSP